MKKLSFVIFVILIISVVFSMPCFAGAYTSGKFTRIGAEYAGNKTGDIPAFEGPKDIKCPGGWQPGDFMPTPWPDEKPLFRIDHTNVDQYKDKLTPGQIDRLKKAPHLFMNIYPTHRVFEMPEEYLVATEKNVETAKLDENNVLRGYNGGVPFPYPKNGKEAAWNAKSAWSGGDIISNNGMCARVVSPSGKVQKMRQNIKIIVVDQDFRLTMPPIPNPEGIRAMLLTNTIYPPDAKGSALLAMSYIDDTRKTHVWSYIPSLRRVRRIPSTDSGFQGAGETMDGDALNGIAEPINDWNWELVGKKENYVLANCYEMWKVDATDEDELVPWGINPELLRYELHRVWIVEATPNEETKNHPYSKKVGFFDEDNWNMTLDDRYDRRGNLWRMGETAQLYRYCDKYREQFAHIMVNLESGRYEVAGGGRTKETRMSLINQGLKTEEFSIEQLKNQGR